MMQRYSCPFLVYYNSSSFFLYSEMKLKDCFQVIAIWEPEIVFTEDLNIKLHVTDGIKIAVILS
jgi:hypothetical protein